jgi:hypothetical protein
MKKLPKQTWRVLSALVILAAIAFAVWMLIPSKAIYIPFQSKISGNWGLISTDGHVLVNDFWPDQPSVPCEGIVRVGPDKDEMYSFYTVSHKPKRIGEAYANALFFSEGLAATSKTDGPIVYIDKKGKPALTLNADPDGKVIVQAGAFFHGLASVVNEDGKWGFVDRKGNFVVPPKYDMVRDFRREMAWVRTTSFGDSNRVVANETFLKSDGTPALLSTADIGYSSISEGIISFTKDRRKSWGLMNASGKVVAEPRPEVANINPFNKGFGVFQNVERKSGLMNRKGSIILAPKYDYIINYDTILTVAIQGRWSYRDLKDRQLMSADFERAYPFFGRGALVRDGGKWSIVSRHGKQINKAEIATVNANALEDYFGRTLGASCPTARTDLFTPDMVVRKVEQEVSSTRFNGIDQTTPPDQVLTILSAKKPNYYCNGNNLSIHNRRVGMAANYAIEVVYDQNIPLNEAGIPVPGAKGAEGPLKIAKITYSLTLSSRKAEKAPDVAEALRQKILASGFKPSQDPMSSGHWSTSPNPLEQWFSSPDGAAHIAVYQSSGFVTVTYRFWDKAE